MKKYVDFVTSLEKTVQAKSNELFNEIYAPFKDDEDMMCSSKSDGDIAFVKKVSNSKEPGYDWE